MDTLTGWISAVRDLLVIFNMLGTIAVCLVAYWAYQTFLPRKELVVELDRRDEKRDQQFAAVNNAVHDIDKRLERGESRFKLIEAALARLPTSEQITGLQLSIERMNGDVRVVGKEVEAIASQVKGVERQVRLVDDYVRNSESRRGAE